VGVGFRNVALHALIGLAVGACQAFLVDNGPGPGDGSEAATPVGSDGATVDGTSAADAGGSADAGSFLCEEKSPGLFCALSSEVCCFEKEATVLNHCASSPNQCPSSSFPAACFNDTDCVRVDPTKPICCGTPIDSDYVRVECTPEGKCGGDRICQRDDQCPSHDCKNLFGFFGACAN
jgi:hypothetical protein